jgi:hypothetical protein
MKGFVNILEMLLAAVAIYISFGVLFPGFYYKSEWNRALLTIENKDAILVMERIGNLYENSFSSISLENFLNDSMAAENVLYWSEIKGTIKNKVILDCNCTKEQLSDVSHWFNQLKLNGRDIETVVCYTNLEPKINPCNDPTDLKHSADVLLIWGYKDLTNYDETLKKFLDEGNGIVEIMDFTNEGQVNQVQNKTFGLKWSARSGTVKYDQFARKPKNSTDIIYSPYKYFYHIPIPLKTISSTTPSVPIESGLSPCYSFSEGNFTLNKTAYKFWNCQGTTVYFDTNANGTADTVLTSGTDFQIRDYNFTLSYIDGLNKIGVTFHPTYLFDDFLENTINIAPSDGDPDKTLINTNLTSNTNASVVILNSHIGRTAWMADFSDTGYGDDERHLLMSLLLWASNKRVVGVLSPNLKIGYPVSYVNVNNTNMFEVYQFDLGLGYPYK